MKKTLIALLFSPCLCAQNILPGEMGDLLTSPYPVCTEVKRACVFSAAENLYQIKKGNFIRESNGKTHHKIHLLDKGDKILIAALSGGANVLAVAIANQTLSRRAFGFGARPDDLDRSYRIGLYSPKSGSLIKTFDLGAFSPATLELSADGQLVLVAGHDIERREIKEVRIYNARSGRLVHSSDIDDADNIKLYSNGYAHNGKAWVVRVAGQDETVVYSSRDPFAIAEYEVTCSSFVNQATLSDQHSIGILPIIDDGNGQSDIFNTGLITGFKKAGFNAIERSQLKTLLEEIQFSLTGLTSSQQILDIGQLISATHLVLSEAKKTGGNTVVNSRLVTVSSGQINSSCNLLCRDCEQQDLFEGVSKMAGHWLNKPK